MKATERIRMAWGALTGRGVTKALNGVDDRGWMTIFESKLGAWQRNEEIRVDRAVSNPTVYACATQIASDVAKLGLGLRRDTNGIWMPAKSPAFSPVLRKPNHYQTRQKFVEQWLLSLLLHGNFYAIKRRDNRGVVIGMYPLDPGRVKPLVSDSGQIFYELNSDDLAGLPRDIPAVPAAEMIHATNECLFHPLVGVSPLYAASLAALQGLNIQNNSTTFFGNQSQPGGVLLAPGRIADDTAKRLKEHWERGYTGDNAGKIAVLGDGLKYEPLARTAVESQLVDQLKWSDEKICSVFKMPPWRIYVGPMPTYQNVQALTQIYYDGCLQRHIEAIEATLDEALSLPEEYRVQFDLSDLLRMDTATKTKTVADAIVGGVMSPNEGRRQFDLPPVAGGDTPYLQQQNYSLAALDERDRNDPFAKPAPVAPVVPDEPEEEDVTDKALYMLLSKAPEELHHA